MVKDQLIIDCVFVYKLYFQPAQQPIIIHFSKPHVQSGALQQFVS